MAINRHIKCEQCGGTFWQQVEKRSSPPPDECPLCHGTGEQTEAALVWISRERREADRATRSMVSDGRGPGYNADARNQLRSEEQVFRAMSDGSKVRAELAASDMGVPVSDMDNIRITNMKDNVRPGETSAKIPMTQEALVMQGKAHQMSFGGGGGSAFAGNGTIINGQQVGTLVGPGAGRHGSSMQDLLTGNHAAKAAEVATRGNMGRHG